MAFNPFSSFQKNRKFWMVSILMVCIITFVFFPSLNKQMETYVLNMIRPKGTAVARVGGQTLTSQDLHELKEQRNLANDLMMRCADAAFKKISKMLYDEGKNEKAQDSEQRKQTLSQWEAMRMSLAYRKSRKRYFESGTKFDDLLEFKLWQAQADQMGIWLADEHLMGLIYGEFFSADRRERAFHILTANEVNSIAYGMRRDHSNFNEAKLYRAMMEEFRVRIAQYAVMGVQPWSFYTRQARPDVMVPPKYTFPDMPDEIRAPMTPDMLWDFFKKKRAEFDVTLIPVHVEDLVKNVKEPSDLDKEEYFRLNKNKVFDARTGEMGLEIPTQIKVEYLVADASSPAYLNLAKANELIDATSPLAWNPMQSPVVTAARYFAAAQAEKMVLQGQYDMIIRDRITSNYLTAPYNAPDVATPMLAYFAKQHPQAAAGLVASAFLAPMDRGMAEFAGYLAWGMSKEHQGEFEAGVRAELDRRAPFYAEIFAASTSRQPLDLIVPLTSISEVNPRFPVEVVQTQMREMIAKRKAEEWARESMAIARTALDNAKDSEAKFQRELKKLIPELKLTYGPPDADKGNYYSRYTIENAKELAPLKDAYLAYYQRINFYEGRDSRPETMLKADEFYKMFFDTEPFAATAKYRAMPWPPAVAPNTDRLWKSPDPRVFDLKNLAPEEQGNFVKHIKDTDPNQPIPPFDMFGMAEKPMLFWRTDEVSPLRLTNYDEISKKLDSNATRMKKLQSNLEAAVKPFEKAKLKKEENDLKIEAGELKEIQSRIVAGWKFDRARLTEALPRAREIGLKLIKRANDDNVIRLEANTLKRDTILLPRVSDWHEEPLGNRREIDYFEFPLPKDQIVFPREDMVEQIVKLYDLKAPVESGDPELDKLNKELFDQADKKPGGFVQVLTNKPRSVFYVAVITRLPNAGLSELGRFAESIRMSPYESQFLRDNFLNKAQQDEAKMFRAGTVQDLRRILGYSIERDEARKEFDDRVSGD